MKCIQCGKDAATLIDDECTDCYVEYWKSRREPAFLNYGDTVQIVNNTSDRGKRGTVDMQPQQPTNRRKAEYRIRFQIDIGGMQHHRLFARSDLKFIKVR